MVKQFKPLDLLSYSLTFLFLGVAMSASAPDQYRSGWFLFIISLLMLTVWIVKTHLGTLFSLFVFWVAASGFHVFLNPVSPYGAIALKTDATSGIAISIFLMLAIFLITFPIYLMGTLKQAIVRVGFINCFFMLWSYYKTGQANGFLNNYAMDATLTALIYPNLLHKILLKDAVDSLVKNLLKLICVLIPLVAIFASGATIPVLMLISIFGVMFINRASNIERIGMAAIAVSVFSLLWVRVGTIGNLVSDSGRYQAWIQWLEWYSSHINVWFGSGYGTFEAIGPAIELSNGKQNGFMMWAHNEYLQLYFETGAIGLILGVLLLGRLIYLSRDSELNLATLAALSVGLTAQPIFRHYLPVIFILSFVLPILKGAQNGNRTQ